MRLVPLAALALLILPRLANAAEINLSFYGWDSEFCGCFAEATDPEAFLILSATIGPVFGDSPYHFGIRSRDHDDIGCDLDNTGTDPGCGGYDLTFWFEPGSVVIGHVTTSDQACQIEGEAWQGHEPTDFDAIRAEYVSGGPCDLPRTLIIPIYWAEDSSVPPPPTESRSWGELKAAFY